MYLQLSSLCYNKSAFTEAHQRPLRQFVGKPDTWRTNPKSTLAMPRCFLFLNVYTTVYKKPKQLRNRTGARFRKRVM